MPTSERSLDLLLINPGGRRAIYQSLGEELTAVEPPVWAGLMATYLRHHRFSVSVLDADALELSPEEAASQAVEASPLLTAVVVYGHQPSASTQTMSAAGEICAAMKKLNPTQKILLVGGHVAALPERTLREESVDFVCTGEGPVTLLELIQALKSGRPDEWSSVRGLCYRENGAIQWTPPAPLVKELEGPMTAVAWDLLPMERYRAHNWHCLGNLHRKPYAAIYTTLGCPYHCAFCCIQAPFKSGEQVLGLRRQVNSYRYWSVDSILAQIDELVTKYGVSSIKIADEMFVLNPAHVLGICDGLIERGYRLNLWAYARVDTVRDEMLDKLKRAGFHWLAFGIESANPRVREDVEKGYGQEKIFKTIRKVREAGIHVIANYIFGLPEDDLGTMQETLDLAIELSCEFANFYCAMAYPGSELYAKALREGWELPKDWSGYSQHAPDTLPLRTNYLKSEEVLQFRDRAFEIYFNHPRYLQRVERTFGAEGVEQIRRMLSFPMTRRFATPDSMGVRR